MTDDVPKGHTFANATTQHGPAKAGRYVFVGVITVIAAGVPLRNTRATGAVLILDNPCLLMRHQRQRDGIHIGEEPV